MTQLDHSRPTTVAAIATAPGTAAVSMIRLSGPDAIQIADRASAGAAGRATVRCAKRCRILHSDGSIIDDGLLTVFRAPHSYTGEETVEFTGHGGIVATRAVLDRFLECGAEPAGPGEFTMRAFLNGRIDLTQAEGVMDVISAQTRLALRAAHCQLDGALGKRTLEARNDLLETLAHMEAWIDFPEEDIDPASSDQWIASIRKVCALVDALLATADQGRILREGVRVVIFGPPNVGKSSLLNRLLGHDRAIVSETAGTTRDTIEESINLDGIPLRIVDTAGMRDADDSIEAEGIRRTLHQIDNADLLLEIADASQPPPTTPDQPNRNTRRILILNKSDLPEHPKWADRNAVRLSCQENTGFDDLSQAIRQAIKFDDIDWGEQMIAINARHQACLSRARQSLQAAITQLGHDGLHPELAAIDLRDALDALGEIPGKVDTEDLLGVIFSRFCIGK